MDGLNRALKYATFRAGRVIGVALLMSVGFVFYFVFLNGVAFTPENLISRFPLMLLFIGNLMVMLYGMLDVATYTQLTLTYGSTRRNAAISVYYMQVVQILVILGIMVLFYTLVPERWLTGDGKGICLRALILFLFGSGLALVSGVLIHRFGKVAYMIVVVICSLGGGVFGGLVGFHGGTDFLAEYLNLMSGIMLLGVIGVIWYAVAAVIFWCFIRKIEVRV